MSRQTRRRRRTRSAEPAPLYVPDPGPLTEAERAHVRQRFAHLRGRALELRFIPGGPMFEAATPEQLGEQVEAWAVSETKGKRLS